MERIALMDKPMSALLVPAPPFTGKGGCRARFEALARWEDDGGLVPDRSLTFATELHSEPGGNRVQTEKGG